MADNIIINNQIIEKTLGEYRLDAALSADEAASSANNAASSAIDAAEYAADSAASAVLSRAYAQQPEDQVVTGATGYSALHYAAKSEASAADAAESASASSNSATAAYTAALQAAEYEGPWFDTSDDVTMDTSLTFVPGQPTTVAEGSIVRTRRSDISLKVANNTILTAFEWRTNPTGYHRKTTGSVPFYVNMNKYELSAEAFGCRFSGNDADASANRTAAQRALDYLYAQGQGGRIRLASDGVLKIDKPLVLRDGVILDGKGCYVHNTRTAEIAGGDLSTAVFGCGFYAKQDDDNFSYIPVSAISMGQDYVTPVSTIGWQVGDTLQIIEAVGTFGSGGVVPNFSQFAVVRAISGGSLFIDSPIGATISSGSGTLGSNATGAWIANVSYRVNYNLTAGLTDARHVVRDVSLLDLRVGTAKGAWMQRCGVVNGLFENIEIIDSPYGFFGNGFARCRVRGLRGLYYTRAIEIKVGSHDTTIEDFSLRFSPRVSDTSDPPETVVSIGESARDIIVRGGTIDVGTSTGYAALVTFAAAKDSGVDTVKIKGAGSFANVLNHSLTSSSCYIRNCEFVCGSPLSNWLNLAGIAPNVTGCRFVGNASAGIALLQTGLNGGRIENNAWSGDGSITIQSNIVGSPKIANNRGIVDMTLAYQHTVDAVDNNSTAWQSVLSQVRPQVNMGAGIALTANTETIIGNVSVIPANVLKQEDVFAFVIQGTKTGSAGTATINLRLKIDVDADGISQDVDDTSQVIFGGVTIPASCTDWMIEGELRVNSTTTAVVYGKSYCLSGGTVGLISGDVSRRLGVVLTSPWRFELSGYVTSGDVLTLNTIKRSAKRFGMVST